MTILFILEIFESEYLVEKNIEKIIDRIINFDLILKSYFH